MIERHFQKGDARSSALYSGCERYRYALTRVWDAAGPRLCYVMLNPSKATEAQNDPTIERCERRARALGYGGFRAVNIFAWRDTDPAALRRAADPVGPENDAALLDAAGWADDILAAWGVHGALNDRGPTVARLLLDSGHAAALHQLGLTRDGHPRHPLYVAYAVKPMPWTEPKGSKRDAA